jgi:hypothetical protein
MRMRAAPCCPQRVLSDLGLLEGKAAREVAACVEANMRAADEAGEGVLSLEAFSRCGGCAGPLGGGRISGSAA